MTDLIGSTQLERATCPRCGVDAPMIPIVFGYPMPETFEAADRGEIILGGCVVWGEDPTHRCSACDRDVIIDQPNSTVGSLSGGTPQGGTGIDQ